VNFNSFLAVPSVSFKVVSFALITIVSSPVVPVKSMFSPAFNVTLSEEWPSVKVTLIEVPSPERELFKV
jgi:hypothetical protein